MSYESFYNQVVHSQAAQKKKDITVSDKTYDAQIGIVEDTYGKQMRDTESSYDELQRENTVQKHINLRNIRENMANMGLSDSGLSRSQITAANLSHLNRQSNINLDMQRSVDALALEMNSRVTELKTNKESARAQIESSYDSAAREGATSMYNSYVDAQATAQQEANNNEKTRTSAYNKLVNDFARNRNGLYGEDEEKYTQVERAIMVKEFIDEYGMPAETGDYSARRALDALLEEAGISYDMYAYFLKHGKMPKNARGELYRDTGVWR